MKWIRIFIEWIKEWFHKPLSKDERIIWTIFAVYSIGLLVISVLVLIFGGVGG